MSIEGKYSYQLRTTSSGTGAAVGRTIDSVALTDSEELLFKFTDGSSLSISDEGQSCCESRYITCDDHLSYYSGATFLDATVVDGPEEEDPDEWTCHEQRWLVVTTSKGDFRATTHNEHNGYYGGFCINAKFEESRGT